MNLPLTRYWALLVNYLRPQWVRTLLLALFLFGNIGLSLLNPQIVRNFIDTALSGGERSMLFQSAMLFLAVAFAGQILTVLATYCSEQISWTATNALRFDLVAHCLKLDPSFHKEHTPGELIERIDGDVETLSNFFSRFVINIVGNLVLLLGVMALLFREGWHLGVGMLAFAILALGVMIRIRQVAIPYWKEVRQLSADYFGFLGEQLTSTEDIRANGAQDYVLRRFYGLLQRWMPIQIKAYLAGVSMWMASIAIFALGNMTAFGLSAYLWQRGAITIGAVYLVFRYTELIRQPIVQIRNELTDLQQAEAGVSRIATLLGAASRLQDTGAAELPYGALDVAVEGVSFSYDGDETVLSNISFHLAPGKTLGLLGRTGSGKTTLARLLLRLYDPGAGEICLGGLPTTAISLAALRQRVGLVTQDVQLFQASVRDNVRLFNQAIDDTKIYTVLADLGLDGWLHSLPAGLDTKLAAGGLSAGQAQLLALARIFLADPGLIVLDEASARLDPATERLLERAVDKLLHNRTAILIAHRLGTVQRVDEILILEQGRVLEHGARSQLAANPDSHFHRLLQVGLEEVLA
jgi:ATP-binding cassette subfamily B protein/ATP-binding cassette subfamily C protein